MTAPSSLPFLFAATILITISLCHRSSSGQCIQRKSEALLKLKSGLTDTSKRLVSWDGEVDCCSWCGVICNNFNGRVLELHLQVVTDIDEYSVLGGNISESLIELKHLKYLDLSNNDFRGISIPKFFGFISSLRFLNLSRARFEGLIPHQLGNLSNLQWLDLSSDMSVDKLDWVSRLSSMKFLDLSYVNLSKAIDWLESLGKLPSLQQLHLSNCQRTQIPPLLNPLCP